MSEKHGIDKRPYYRENWELSKYETKPNNISKKYKDVNMNPQANFHFLRTKNKDYKVLVYEIRQVQIY